VRRDLVVVRAGRGSLHPGWASEGAPRGYDLWVVPYEDGVGAGDAVFPTIPGPKWAGLSRFLASEPAWRRHDRVWFPDDDLAADAATVGRFLAACRTLDAPLAAPALAEGSAYSHLLSLRNRSFRSRETTFVEIMAPAFRRDVLERLVPTFSEGRTGHGWGLDDAWGRLLGYRGLFVVDATPVLHARPVGAARSMRMRAALRSDLRLVRRRFGAGSLRKTLAGTREDGTVLREDDPRFLDAYLEGYRWLLDSRPDAEARLRRDQAKDPARALAGSGAPTSGTRRSLWRRLAGVR
jgi:hypothetical protein